MLLNWECKFFGELSVDELYQVMRLRSWVFVVEQNCIFLDADNKDQQCYHLAGYNNGTLVAYARLVPPGLSYREASIGRVVTSPGFRSFGAGKLLMAKAIETCLAVFKQDEIRIGAQLYLKKFYEGFNFSQSGEVYMEDGIEHIEMLFTLK